MYDDTLRRVLFMREGVGCWTSRYTYTSSCIKVGRRSRKNKSHKLDSTIFAIIYNIWFFCSVLGDICFSFFNQTGSKNKEQSSFGAYKYKYNAVELRGFIIYIFAKFTLDCRFRSHFRIKALRGLEQQQLRIPPFLGLWVAPFGCGIRDNKWFLLLFFFLSRIYILELTFGFLIDRF